VSKSDGSKLDEKWFDCDVPINKDLVAIIGNQGNGKSALTDIIALCGQTSRNEFSFLNGDKFRDRKNKAGEFEAVLTWEDGTSISTRLDQGVESEAYERVRYVPQRFFEDITNETVVQEGGKFYGEIKKAIFSHIEETERLGCHSLDNLLKKRASEIYSGLNMLRDNLSKLNSQIVGIERECSPSEVTRLENAIEAKRAEIDSHTSNKPQEVNPPAESEEKTKQIDDIRAQEADIQSKIERLTESLQQKKTNRVTLEQTKQAIEREHLRHTQEMNRHLDTLKLNGLDLSQSDLYSASINVSPIETLITSINVSIEEIESQLDLTAEGSLRFQMGKLETKRERLTNELEQVGKNYQEFRDSLEMWQMRLNELQGSRDTPESLRWLEQQVNHIREVKPKELANLEEERRDAARKIYEYLFQLITVYQELTGPVQGYIQSNLLTREKYRVEFSIELVQSDFADRLFAITVQNTGTFSGTTEGRERLQKLIEKHNFDSPENALNFVEDVLDNLRNNYKNSPPTSVEMDSLLRRTQTTEDLYDLLFGFEYLLPQYSLSLNGKSLKQLSPGERGILLLVFYLIVDRGDEPLIIDQPEGNLNNQSIFANLVPVFKEAKNRRQIIVVTHNPNLAVVCDAEQIIHSRIDFEDGNRVILESGALENPVFNQLSLDVLEGTSEAFDARQSTYSSRI